ncbi:hypothetical protein [Salinibaculum salinum]
MAAIGPTLFGLLLWGGIVGVFLVFCYEVYIVVREAGWLVGNGP